MGVVPEGAFNLLCRPGLRENFGDEYQDWEKIYTQYLKSEGMDMPEMSATIMTGVSRMFQKGDLESVRFESPKIGPKVVGTDKEFGVGVAIGRRILEDDQYGKINQSGKWLANAGKQTYEYRSAEFLDDAFAGSTFKGIDGLSLINASHTFLNATGVWSNYVGTIGFSMTAVIAMMDVFGTMKNHDGDPIMMNMNKVVIGNNQGDIHAASQIFNNQKEPYTADHNDNTVKRLLGKVDVVVQPYKVSSKSYFGIDSKYNDAEFRIRRPIKMDDSFDFKTDATLAKITTRFMIWFVLARGWAGGNPA